MPVATGHCKGANFDETIGQKFAVKVVDFEMFHIYRTVLSDSRVKWLTSGFGFDWNDGML